MCGIVGFIQYNNSFDRERAIKEIQSMSKRILHRGPDHGGYWFDEENGVVFGHRRLSIVDLSAHGEQPMISSTGRYVISFNGEIYNHTDIKKQLLSEAFLTFRGYSDTEILLAAIERWGIKAALEQAVGMFAIAVWDRRDHKLTLTRDRLGEKPLYYGFNKGNFFFSSELKAMIGHSDFVPTVNRNAVAQFIQHNYIPSPHSILEGIQKLMPGTMLELIVPTKEFATRSYWSISDLATKEAIEIGEEEAINHLEQLVDKSIGQQMLADVPLGAFLSGGIDSSTVVASMQKQSKRSIKTFSIGFDEEAYNEAHHAKNVAAYLNTVHTEFYVTAKDALNVIPELQTIYDEPFADVSQIPTILLSRLSKQHVTVTLSGDGGDELFGGYSRYTNVIRIWGQMSKLPNIIRTPLSSFLKSSSPMIWGDKSKILLLAELLKSKSMEHMYLKYISHTSSMGQLVLQPSQAGIESLLSSSPLSYLDDLHKMIYMDTISYLPDDVLVKLDRASMSTSLESRIPLLDHRIVEFAWSIPTSLKINHGESKYILKKLLKKSLPQQLVDRPKMGFGVPISKWLRGPLKWWADALLDDNKIRKQGYLSPLLVRKLWSEHADGKKDWGYVLWNILMFQAWLNEYIERE
ncbi:asparagine synthase (glutamine-hydrolyzing) [Paenibacillus koleovorans]|uniref:asparagine synthase (glutamine-hydrolyzing) n=1 Tax=Paenibacillus koleovorans TaxID=121608 RepID=UPI000FD9F9BE|nr:asparagine synthase (glutamine-hydrolyzing) [Paenibacillus koleovorans]